MTNPDDRLDCSDMDAATDSTLLYENKKLRAELDKERWQHAACLAIAEGGTGWNELTWAESGAIRAVRKLRADYNTLALCGHDHTAQWWELRCNELQGQLTEAQATITRLKGVIAVALGEETKETPL